MSKFTFEDDREPSPWARYVKFTHESLSPQVVYEHFPIDRAQKIYFIHKNCNFDTIIDVKRELPYDLIVEFINWNELKNFKLIWEDVPEGAMS